MKEFYEEWTEDEIDEHVDDFGILVLFTRRAFSREAELTIHGDISPLKKDLMKKALIEKFGGKTLTKDLCIRINEVAEVWYYKYICKKATYVLNFGKNKNEGQE